MSITLASHSLLKHLMKYLVCPMRVVNFCASREVYPIMNLRELKRLYLGNIATNSLKTFKMSNFTPLNRVLYHIIVSIHAPTSGHKVDLIHIGLYEILHQVKISIGAFMIKYMMMCKEDSIKELAYGRIFIFTRCNVPLDGIVGTRPSDTDRIGEENLKRLHLIFRGGRWLKKVEDG